jgi:hypothetical protein
MGVASVEASNTLLKYNALDAYLKGLYTCGYDPKMNRLVFFLKSGDRIVGAVGRALSPKVKPKSYNYPHSKVMPFIVGKSRVAVIVEDCLSACAVASVPGFTGVALLGTQLKVEYYEYLRNYDTIFVALDRDVKNKTYKMSLSLTLVFPSVKTIYISRDFKDMSKEEIVKVLGGLDVEPQ